MMKKRYAMMMAAAVLTGIMATASLAEGPAMNGQPPMSGAQMPGGSENGQPPQMNGQAPQGEAPTGEAPTGEAPTDGQMPEMNGQAPQGEAPTGEAPTGEAPTGEAPTDGQMPEMNGQGQQGQAPQMDGKGPQGGMGFISFDSYVEDGTISQETYDAITKYMEENKPELPEGEMPEMKEGEQPELPEGEMPEMKEGEGPDLLKDLLEAGVITQDEYDALAAAREANRPAAPETTGTTDDSTAA